MSDSLTIHGTLAIPPAVKKPCPGVIIFHGMTSSENSYITLTQSLAEQGIAGLAISMRGHGESEGDFERSTVAEAISDALAAYDFLVSQPEVDATSIGLVGSSVGAILAAMVSDKRLIRSIVFRAPAAYTAEMMRLSMAETMVNENRQFHQIGDLEATPAGNAIRNFNGSLLVVASENDALIPLSIPKAYINAAMQADKKQLYVIEGAPHTLTEPRWKETLQNTILKWFNKTLQSK